MTKDRVLLVQQLTVCLSKRNAYVRLVLFLMRKHQFVLGVLKAAQNATH